MTTDGYPWYGLADGSDLAQGDILELGQRFLEPFPSLTRATVPGTFSALKENLPCR
jgi:hypothetical protein